MALDDTLLLNNIDRLLKKAYKLLESAESISAAEAFRECNKYLDELINIEMCKDGH